MATPFETFIGYLRIVLWMYWTCNYPPHISFSKFCAMCRILWMLQPGHLDTPKKCIKYVCFVLVWRKHLQPSRFVAFLLIYRQNISSQWEGCTIWNTQKVSQYCVLGVLNMQLSPPYLILRILCWAQDLVRLSHDYSPMQHPCYLGNYPTHQIHYLGHTIFCLSYNTCFQFLLWLCI